MNFSQIFLAFYVSPVYNISFSKNSSIFLTHVVTRHYIIYEHDIFPLR